MSNRGADASKNSGSTAAVLAALFAVLWRERRTARDASVALLAGGVLSLVGRGRDGARAPRAFQPRRGIVPPVGINLVVVLFLLTVSLATSASLRRLLTRQKNLIRLHLWRSSALSSWC